MHARQLISLSGLFLRACQGFTPDTYYIFLKNHIIRRVKNILQFNTKIKPDIFGIELSTFCPWDCSDCYVPKEMRRDKTIIKEDLLLSALRQVRQVGIRLCGFMGGEPIRKETVPLIYKAASQNSDLTFIICTNGDYIFRNDVSYARKELYWAVLFLLCFLFILKIAGQDTNYKLLCQNQKSL